MPHIHELIAFTVAVFVVYQDKVLLIHHKKLNMWLPLGGHIELNEDPDQAVYREVKEEPGLEVEIWGKKPNFPMQRAKLLHAPIYLDIHPIDEIHKHIGMIYFAKAKSDFVKLAVNEHNHINWFTEEELKDPQYGVISDTQFYVMDALEKLSLHPADPETSSG